MPEEVIITKPNLEPEKWVERYADFLFGFAMSRLSKKEVAEDIVQETFLAAWNARESFKSNSTEKTWLTSILRNKIVDYYRKSSTRNELNILDNDSSNSYANYFFDDGGNHDGHWVDKANPQNWKKDLGNLVEQKEFQNILQQCLGKLPVQTRAVFVMKQIEDEDSETICKELAISPSNYWVLMHRAKLHLRECMEKIGRMFEMFKMNCREATLICQKKSEGKISISESVGLWFHRLRCSLCRLFFEQTELISQQAKKMGNNSDPTLNETKKQKISTALNNEMKK